VPVGETHTEEVKNSQMRKTIARRLAESKYTAPHYYLTIELNMDNAMVARKTINSLPDTKVISSTLIFGSLKAYSNATASSIPGSQSIMIFLTLNFLNLFMTFATSLKLTRVHLE